MNTIAKNDLLHLNHDLNTVVFVNEVSGSKVSYSDVTLTALGHVKTVLDSNRYTTVERLDAFYTKVGNYSKELLND
jgi:hypothetical protein